MLVTYICVTYPSSMRLLATDILYDLKGRDADARSGIESWEAEVKEEHWKNPHELKSRYPKASILGNQNVIFDIRGGRYRLWVRVEYKSGIVVVKKAGTHKEYEKWDIV